MNKLLKHSVFTFFLLLSTCLIQPTFAVSAKQVAKEHAAKHVPSFQFSSTKKILSSTVVDEVSIVYNLQNTNENTGDQKYAFWSAIYTHTYSSFLYKKQYNKVFFEGYTNKQQLLLLIFPFHYFY